MAIVCATVGAAACSLEVLPVPVGGLSQQPAGSLEPSGGGGGTGGGSSGAPGCFDGGDAAACFDAGDANAD
jgi:hypothetical protein